jgi:hypothetical protein
LKRTELIILLILISGCLNIAGDCEVEVINEFPNPANTVRALYASVDCGATTSEAFVIRLDERNSNKGKSENTVLSSARRMNIRWNSNDTLVIYNSDTTEDFNMKKEFFMPKTKSKIIIKYSND